MILIDGPDQARGP